MIRRDYFTRLVAELAQMLAQVVFLKEKKNYQQALGEIDRALVKLWQTSPTEAHQWPVDKWIDLCREENDAVREKLIALANLLKEQGDLYALVEKIPDSQRSRAISLGLYLEALTEPDAIVSVDLLANTGQLIEQTKGSRLPAAVLKKLLSYFEARTMLAKAEDVLFDWLDTGDPEAPAGGLAFYERQAAKPDEELNRGELPRDEVEAGREEIIQRSRMPA
jgi:Family of unknown function (DUF6483)